MEKKVKKEYEKPKITRIRLDATGAVLGFCKSTGSLGPGGYLGNCQYFGGSPCPIEGS